MTTITQLMETINTTIDEANADIEKLAQCNECMANQIEENRHVISWNEGYIAHAEFTLEELEKGQKTAIREVKQNALMPDATKKIVDMINNSETRTLYLRAAEIGTKSDIFFVKRDSPSPEYALSLQVDVVDGNKPSVAHDNDLRTRLAAALHDHTVKWMKIAAIRPEINRDFVDKPFDELAAIDRLAPLRDADTILDVVRGE